MIFTIASVHASLIFNRVSAFLLQHSCAHDMVDLPEACDISRPFTASCFLFKETENVHNWRAGKRAGVIITIIIIAAHLTYKQGY